MPPLYNNFFDLLPISNKQSSRIESIVTWREHFFFGTDNRVHIYQILGYDTKKPESKPRAVIAVTTSAGKSAPVKQLALLPEKNCMVLLCGDSLVVHALPNYELICRDAVPANLFDVTKDALRDPGDVGGFHIKRDNGKYLLTCFTTTRKVLVFEYYDNAKAFKKVGEYPIPEKPRSIAWVGQRILLAFKGSYTLLTPTGSGGGAIVAGKGAEALPEMIMDTGRSGESCIVNLDPHGEYLIGIDTIGGRVPIHGKSPSAGCKWQCVPLSITYRDPYVLTVQNDSMEVYYPWRSSHSHSLVHSLTRKGVNRISQRSFVRFDEPASPRDSINDQRRDAIVLVDSSNSVYLFHMLTLDQQVGELIAQNEFDVALELCEHCDIEVSEKMVRTVHFKFAMARLFNNPDLDTLSERLRKALEHFNTCEADPLHVISLFPNFLPRELAEYVRAQSGGSSSTSSDRTLPLERNATVRDKCLELLLGYLEVHRSRIMGNRAAALGSIANGEGPSLAQQEARAEAERRTLTAIDTALLKTYTYLRREDKLATSLLLNTAAPHHCAVDNCLSFLLERGEWVALALFRRSKGLHDAALRDLRLLGARGALPDGAAASTTGASSSSAAAGVITPCPPNLPKLLPDVVDIIRNRFTMAELSNTRKFMTRATIESKIKEDLAEMSERARSYNCNQVVGILTTLTYLRTSLDISTPYHADLHAEYCKWLLRDLPPRMGVLLFTGLDVQGVPTAKSANFFDPSEVVSKILETISGGATSKTAITAAYLQTVLGEDCEGSVRESLHDLQVKVLIELIGERKKRIDAGEDGGDDGEGYDNADESSGTAAAAAVTSVTSPVASCSASLSDTPEKRLLVFLKRSRHYNAKLVVQWLERGELASYLTQQRAVVYQRQGEHQKAITMFLQEGRDMGAAKEYATNVSKEGFGGDAFKLLLEELTRQSDTDSAETKQNKMKEALKVVNTCVGVDALTAVPMLPDETPLHELSAFLVASLRASHTSRRNLEVSAAISTTQREEAHLAVQMQRKRFVTLDDSSVCCKCGFKIRKDTMFAVFPNGNMAHQLCYDHESIDPSTKQDFRQGIHTIYL